MSTPVDARVRECWERGNGIVETQQAVRQSCGVTLTFEETRARFVALSEAFPGTMPLEKRIVSILEMKGLTPDETAAKILTLPELRLRQINVAVMDALARKRVFRTRGNAHGRPRA